MVVQDRTLLSVATRVLIESPTASLADVAAAAGVSRTTLHGRFPTRQALLVALAEDAMDRVEQVYAEAQLDQGDVRAAVLRLVELLVPLGPQTEYLLRERSLDTETSLTARYASIDRPVADLVERGQQDGTVRRDLPSWWVVAALMAAVSAAWEAIADGRLAPRDAPRLVLGVVVDGAAPR